MPTGTWGCENVSNGKKGDKQPKKMVLGDDPIESFEADWFDFKTPAVDLAKQLYEISKSSGVCCGIIGSWGGWQIKLHEADG